MRAAVETANVASATMVIATAAAWASVGIAGRAEQAMERWPDKPAEGRRADFRSMLHVQRHRAQVVEVHEGAAVLQVSQIWALHGGASGRTIALARAASYCQSCFKEETTLRGCSCCSSSFASFMGNLHLGNQEL